MGLNRWLITGGCGFIGTNLIRELVTQKNNRVRVVDNLAVGTRKDLATVCNFFEPAIGDDTDQQVELWVGDILDEKLALRATQGMDVIVHLAANTGVGPSVEDPRADCVTNVIGTLNYLEAARSHRVKKFLFASSGAPVGECDPPIHENLAPHPESPYGASKLAGEGYCSAYFRSFGVETVALRFGNVYGPGSDRKNSVVAKLIRKVLSGKTFEIYGDGEQTRDFIYVGDLVRALLLAAERPGIGGEIFQIATNRETTIRELTKILCSELEKLGCNTTDIVNSPPRAGDVRRNYSDTSKAGRMLGWYAKEELVSGLRKTIQSILNFPH